MKFSLATTIFMPLFLATNTQAKLFRRMLREHGARLATPEEVAESCPDSSTVFRTFLHVTEAHLLIVAKSDDGECPNLAFHTLNGADKDILIWDEGESPTGTNATNRIENEPSFLEKGQFTLEELLAAFDEVQLGHNSYDVVTNNCGTFVLDMFCYLGITPTRDDLDFVVTQLSATEESQNSILDNLRESSHAEDLPILMDDSNSDSEQHRRGVIADLVFYYAAINEGACVAKILQQSKSDKEVPESFIWILVVDNLVWLLLVAAGCVWMRQNRKQV